MTSLLLALWLWDTCPGEQPVAWRVEFAHKYVVGTEPGMDENGGLVIMPVYNPWGLTFVQESAMMSAVVPCEPGRGELCASKVTSLDEYGMEDLGEDCE